MSQLQVAILKNQCILFVNEESLRLKNNSVEFWNTFFSYKKYSLLIFFILYITFQTKDHRQKYIDVSYRFHTARNIQKSISWKNDSFI